ncbi:MAG: BNR repeat-containing protein [Draconibacterium sp.]|nr:BNR repeat-containing protein [Draconibacterium sp.]
MRTKILPIVILLIYSLSVSSQIIMEKVSDYVVDEFALTIDGGFGQAINGKSFQQDIIVTHSGYQYLAYYDSARNVCLGRRKVSEKKWEIIRFKDYYFKSNDAHNTISIGICPNDGTIHLAFDHHGHFLHYRISEKGVASQPKEVEWKTSLFGPVVSDLEAGNPIKITYPRFWQTPEGELQFCYRRGGSGNGDRMLVDYNSKTGKWENTRQIDSGKGLFKDRVGESKTRCSYPNGYTYSLDGILHATWVWRESSQGANHDLVYVFSKNQGKTWLNNSGEVLPKPPNVNSPDITVADIERTYGLMNTHGQDVDSKGQIHVVMWHCSDESLEKVGSNPGDERWGPLLARRYHHYWRNPDGSWNHTELPWVAGTRPKIFIDKSDDIFLIYSTRDNNLDEDHKLSYNEQDLIIACATKKSGYSDWQIIHVEKGPFVNEMLADYYLWKKKRILSVVVQEMPEQKHQPTPLRVLDFSFSKK